jgi:hypothetical protein
VANTDLIVARATVTIDGVAGSVVLAVCDRNGDISLSCDGRGLAESQEPAENNLYKLRTARAAAYERLADLLSELESKLGAATDERRRRAKASIALLREQLQQV